MRELHFKPHQRLRKDWPRESHRGAFCLKAPVEASALTIQPQPEACCATLTKRPGTFVRHAWRSTCLTIRAPQMAYRKTTGSFERSKAARRANISRLDELEAARLMRVVAAGYPRQRE